MSADLVYLGYRDYYGREAYACPHVAVLLPLVEELAYLRGYITKPRFTLMQAQGGAAASAGYHLAGTCLDIAERSDRITLLFREAGFPGTWPRGVSYGQATMPYHTHAACWCPCDSPADSQITDVKAGLDGLAGHGPDYGPRPDTWRTWYAGKLWLTAQIAHEKETQPHMITDADVARIAAATAKATAPATTEAFLEQLLGRSGPTVAVALQSTYMYARAAAAGADLDEAQIAASLAGLIGPQIRDAVVAAVRDGGTPDAIAAAVIDQLAAALTQDVTP